MLIQAAILMEFENILSEKEQHTHHMSLWLHKQNTQTFGYRMKISGVSVTEHISV